MAEEQASETETVNYPAASLGHSVISIVNKLQDIVAQIGVQTSIDLPQVAVVGSQSSGKSSVLEALVGRDFLPRGSDMCTRRPLVLQLIQTKRKGDGSMEEWGEFLHLPDKKMFDFNDIRNEIQADTKKEAGGNKGVSDKQIRLKFFSPNVLDITLVDLPGLTKVPVGNQPSDIEARIRTMIMSYIERPGCLILAVTPANSGLANSDALQMAATADPDGYRTIGVITKLDIMDRGTDARNVLLGKVIPLHHGYVGVVNRSQEDIQYNRSIKEALIAEEKFFRSRPVYNEVAEHCGVPQLTKKLNTVLIQHIKTVLPGLKSHISSELLSVAKEHASYEEITDSKEGQGALLLNIISKYSEAFSSLVEGKNESKLSGGSRIHYIFQNTFIKSLEEVDPCEFLTDEDIRTAIQNATGTESALFVPEVAFENLIRRQIARLRDPSLQCARFIFDELIEMSHRCMVNEFQRFPVLRKQMVEVISTFLKERLKPSERMIETIIDMEMDYINTSDTKFMGWSTAVEMALQQVKSSNSRQKEIGDSEEAPNSETSLKPPAILAWQENEFNPEQGARAVADGDKTAPSASNASTTWCLPSIFCVWENLSSVKENPNNKPFNEPVQSTEHDFSMIHLREEAVEITVTKLLLRPYYDIARKNIEHLIPKAIMHFLVNDTKRELRDVFIKELYRDNLFEEMFQEPDEIAMKRKRARDTLHVLKQAFRTLDQLPLEAESVIQMLFKKN